MALDLVPRPRTLEVREGTLRWTSPLRVAAESDWQGVVETFAQDLMTSIGWAVVFVGADDSPDLRVRAVTDCGPEEYRLNVEDDVTIDASSPAGVAYALCLLRQLGPAAMWAATTSPLDSLELPRVFIDDGPRYRWRGVHLDVSRHFFDVATVCRFIDLIAAHRLNRLHLHLNDDQGWRIEVPGWPRLTEVGSTRRSTPIGHEDEGRDDHVAYGGFYTAGDVEVIREHARRRFVQIVPEIDLPGHAQAAIAAYPELGNLGEPLEVWTRWGISEHVLNVAESTLAFAEEVVRYVAGLFPGSPVHIGGDECPTGEWRRSAQANEVMVEHGFHDVRQLQGLFTTRLTAALHSEGHEVIAWDEIMEADVAPGVVITAWRSSTMGIAAAQKGLDVIMAPMQFLYLDWLNSDHAEEPVALAPPPAVTPWEKVYSFSVIPPGLDEALRHHVRGAQVQLWTEYIATRDHLDYMAFPRISAFSEVVWGTSQSVDEFRPRLASHTARLCAMGVALRELD